MAARNKDGVHNALRFKTLKQLEDKINGYFEDRIERQLPMQVFSLQVFLGIDDDTFYCYKNGKYDRPDASYSGIIKMAYKRIQSYATDHLFTNRNAVGAIFYLKCQHNWQDTQVTEVINKGSINISFE